MWKGVQKPLKVNLSQDDNLIGLKCCSADFSSVWEPQTHWLLKDILKYLSKPFRHLSKHVFQSKKFRKYLSSKAYLFSKCAKLGVSFRTAMNNSNKIFGFLDICI